MYYKYSSALGGVVGKSGVQTLIPQGLRSKPSAYIVEQAKAIADRQAVAQAKTAPSVAAASFSTVVDTSTLQSVVPDNDRTGPSAAPYGDPNLMMGAGGKLIPKLPKGTRVGKMVMGDHGMYFPEYRANQLLAAKGWAEGKSWYQYNPSFAGQAMRATVPVLTGLVFFLIATETWIAIYGELCFPWNFILENPKK